MSGPKVIRIVTREELISICEQHLARLDVMISEWKSGSSGASLTPNEIAAVTARREALGRLLIDGKFTELQKQVPAEISYLRADLEQRAEKAAAAAAAARQALRRSRLVAQTLSEALLKAGQKVPADLKRVIDDASASASDISSAATRAFALLSPTTDGVTSERQRTLAAELGHGEARSTFAEWLASRLPPDDQGSLRIDGSLAELATLGGDVRSFEERALKVMAESVLSRRALLADSLTVELASAIRLERERVSLLRDLKESRAALSKLSSEASVLLQARMAAAIDRKEVTEARGFMESANALIAKQMQDTAAVSRRQAILEGLAALGYDVTEGMSAAFAEKGRVVLRKAATPDYGVEIIGRTSTQRLQVRAVALSPSPSRDASRDRDVETIWCGEFAALQKRMADSGGGILIEQALAVGATPLKIVDDFHGQDPDEGVEPRTLQLR